MVTKSNDLFSETVAGTMLLRLLLLTLLLSSVIAQHSKSQQLYVFGGWDEDFEDSSSVSHYNSSTNEWNLVANMSTARYGFCGAVLGTKIYLFGGAVNSSKDLSTAEVYDSESNTYSAIQSLPSGLEGCAAAVLNGSIYVAGGIQTRPHGIDLRTEDITDVIRYNLATNQQEVVSSMSVPRGYHQLVELGGRLYAIGTLYSNTVEAYNSTTNRWMTVASTKYGHDDFGATAHNGKIYVLSKNGFEVYSPEVNDWNTLTSPNDFYYDDDYYNYRGSSLVSMNGQLWALGGSDPNVHNMKIAASKTVQTYDILTNKWTKRADMNIARSSQLAFVVTR